MPPLLGGVIGYFTNDLAITMLFRPYRPLKVGGLRLPFTPGLIPRNQNRLAQRISDSIMGSLLTPSELQKITLRLLAPERVKMVIQWLLELALEQSRGPSADSSAQVLAKVLRDLVNQALPRLSLALSRRESFLKKQLNQIFDEVLLGLHLTEDQSEKLADWVLEVVIPPDTLRMMLIDFLTDRNIQTLDLDLREKTSGTYWVIANLFGARNALFRLRSYCIDDPVGSNQRIAELIVALGIRRRLVEWLSSFSLQSLPMSTVRQLRRNFREGVRSYVQDRGAQVIEKLSRSVDWDESATILLNRLRSSAAVEESLALVSQDLAGILERYLERDIEKLVAQALPILNLDQVIMDRVNATAPEDLETAIQGIVRSELKAIVALGGILGVLVGVLQSVILILR
ncbi:DUF445 domain-containing protein [Lyngbya confervoides]|uniref:DUF445 family protein n=1 Tax=Lyngbya confervoides BDU141951 TaxID=1574623 RepID=A0ABD4T524_9CYAN|nr:DUF445 family protein [Lyngbya confervoides]MCM1983807.1 DUF445 family protein [Lyngbya confervoides BDU141951]